eukprot:CAMPEP_0173449812 /NCGR_PEP_ID=MMETSP1357-20121228/43459_1 /TAXON_ID=77926 /ORGANISM="Hemiselmis rufescens, Strain PCC563" /LENGTH=147 /DNA_ID=CAMNT_0014416427 /DNA_START=79 /DNA_END=519 /DNA_ORIENTATION=+
MTSNPDQALTYKAPPLSVPAPPPPTACSAAGFGAGPGRGERFRVQKPRAACRDGSGDCAQVDSRRLPGVRWGVLLVVTAALFWAHLTEQWRLSHAIYQSLPPPMSLPHTMHIVASLLPGTPHSFSAAVSGVSPSAPNTTSSAPIHSA